MSEYYRLFRYAAQNVFSASQIILVFVCVTDKKSCVRNRNRNRNGHNQSNVDTNCGTRVRRKNWSVSVSDARMYSTA